jgi:SAM-dependent methyltransferase
VFVQHAHTYERCRDCCFERMADPVDRQSLDAHYRADREHGLMAYQEHEQNLARFAAIVARIEAAGATGRLLDVGCSVGTSLVAAGRRGWRAEGIELSRDVVDFVRRDWGLVVHDRSLEEIGFPDASFDAVLMHHVLEHLPEPERTIAECCRVLKRGGVMYQALPNHDSLKSRLFGQHWSYGVSPAHLSHFTPRTLAALLRAHGLEPRRTWTFSSVHDPHLLLSAMRRLGCEARLMAWCGRPGQPFDKDAYVRLIADHRWPNIVCNRVWPAAITAALGLGEDLHMLAVRA